MCCYKACLAHGCAVAAILCVLYFVTPSDQMNLDDLSSMTMLHHVFGLMAPSAIEIPPLVKLLLTPTNLQVSQSQHGCAERFR